MAPQYDFEHPETEEIITLFFRMNDDKIYIDDKGVQWRRIFSKPQASIDSQWDHNSEADFVNKTYTKKGTIGDVWDKSNELSEKRAKERGFDPVKHKHYAEYSKARSGNKIHPDLIKEHQKNKKIEVDIGAKLKKKH